MKRRRYTWVVATVLLLASLSIASASPLHTYHTSLMRIDYDQKQELLEISINVFSNDLNAVLNRRYGKNFHLNKSPEAERLILAYVNETVNVRFADGRAMNLTWVGMEAQADTVWLYVEAKAPTGLDGVEIRNRILFESFEDQVNRVHIIIGEKKSDLVFKPGDGFKALVPSQRPRK